MLGTLPVAVTDEQQEATSSHVNKEKYKIVPNGGSGRLNYSRNLSSKPNTTSSTSLNEKKIESGGTIYLKCQSPPPMRIMSPIGIAELRLLWPFGIAKKRVIPQVYSQ